MSPTADVIGVIPAAGTGSRLGPEGRLKELLPVWTGPPGTGAGIGCAAAPACGCLVSAMHAAGIPEAVFVVRPGKEELEQTLGPSAYGVSLDYLVASRLDGPPYTVDAAYEYTHGAIVATGFPDVLFQATDPYRVLLNRLRSEPLAAVLGMFPTAIGQKADRVTIDSHGRVEAVDPRAAVEDPRETWALAVWKPEFSSFLHELLKTSEPSEIGQPEPVMGDVINAALAAGVEVGGMKVSDRPFLDIGTPRGLEHASRARDDGLTR